MDKLLHGMRAAAEPTRLRLLALCGQGELTVSELKQILGQSQPRVSRHLKLLVEAGLLERFREGTWAFYRLAEHEPGATLARRLVEMIPEQDPSLIRDLERLDDIKRARAERAAAFFRRNAAEWDEIRRLHVDDAKVEAALLSLLPADTKWDHIDIGTGTGRILEVVGGRVGRAVGIDLSREMLAVARANLERGSSGNCHVRHGDMNQIPQPAESFDIATLHLALHYAEDPRIAIAEAARVLRPGGRLIVVDFAPHHEEHLMSEHAHRWLGFTDKEVARWCELADLVPGEPIHLPGKPLTVCLWPAYRPAEASVAATG